MIFNAHAAIRNCPLPVIGVVQGKALGFGCAVAALCDITIASEAATFQIPEMEHYILPTMVLSAMIDRMTRKGLGYMTWSCATVGPERALSYGIVSDVVPAAKLDETVESLCKFMLKAPAIATEGAKGILAPRHDHGRPERRRFRPQLPRGDQLLERDEAAEVTRGARHCEEPKATKQSRSENA